MAGGKSSLSSIPKRSYPLHLVKRERFSPERKPNAVKIKDAIIDARADMDPAMREKIIEGRRGEIRNVLATEDTKAY